MVRGWLRLGLAELTSALLPTTDNSTAGELTGYRGWLADVGRGG